MERPSSFIVSGLYVWLLAGCASPVLTGGQPIRTGTVAESSLRLPADVALDKDTGRPKHIFVMVRVGHGDDLPFVLDTGSSVTFFDKLLEPQLGRRVRMGTVWRWGVKEESGIYAAPHFYLGGTRLMSGPLVATSDFNTNSAAMGRPVLGILGMDVLSHYCVQLDFEAGKIRFLDGEHADKSKWGRAFPLVSLGDGCLAVNENFAGVAGSGSLIDTGSNDDGWLLPQVFEQWTNQTRLPVGGEVRSPQGVLGGEVYRHLALRGLDAGKLAGDDTHMQWNGIGLHFLSRYLVTFDFPHRTMYLKRPSVWSLIF